MFEKGFTGTDPNKCGGIAMNCQSIDDVISNSRLSLQYMLVLAYCLMEVSRRLRLAAWSGSRECRTAAGTSTKMVKSRKSVKES